MVVRCLYLFWRKVLMWSVLSINFKVFVLCIVRKVPDNT